MYRLRPRGRRMRFARSLTRASKPADTAPTNQVVRSPSVTVPASITRGSPSSARSRDAIAAVGIPQRDPESPGDVVARAGRDHAERQARVTYRLDGQTHHAVATDDDERVQPGLDRSLHRTPELSDGPLLQADGAMPGLLERVEHHRAHGSGRAERRGRVDGDADASGLRGHLPILTGPRRVDTRTTGLPRRSHGIHSSYETHEVRTCSIPPRDGRRQADRRPGRVHVPDRRCGAHRGGPDHAPAPRPLDRGAPRPHPRREPGGRPLRTGRCGRRRGRVRHHRRRPGRRGRSGARSRSASSAGPTRSSIRRSR